MGGKVLILTGAPDSASLGCDSALLPSTIQEPVARFARLSQPITSSSSIPKSSPSFVQREAVWRSLPLERASLHSGFTQQYAANDWARNEDDFFTTAGVSFMSDDGTEMDNEATNNLLSQFYEQSLAIHDQIPSSQLLPPGSTHEATSFVTSEASDSFGRTSYGEVSFREDTTREPLGNRRDIQLHHLKDVPSAAYIIRAQPATVTVNLIAGIISISAPRTIKTRWGSTSSLVEVLVGDETKSGFAITFWLPSDNVQDSELAGLRPQDVVLFQNVALNVFRKKVYGSSLRKGMTKVHLLYRRKLDRSDIGGHYSLDDLSSMRGGNLQLGKTRKVWEWVLNFVGTAPRAKEGRAAGRPWDRPPPDDSF